MALVLFVPFQRSNGIGSRVRSDLVSIPPSFFVLKNNHQTKKGQLYNAILIYPIIPLILISSL